MIYEIKNESLSLKINSLGAEITNLTFYDKTIIRKVEKWDKISPVLFPCIGIIDGNLVNNRCIPKHGYVRLSEFEVVSQSAAEIEFINKNDKKYFEYDCELYVKYSLLNNQVQVSTKVVNLSNSPFNYSIGHHPAIIVDDRDYSINFKESEILYQGDTVIQKQKSLLTRCEFENVDTLLVSNLSQLDLNFSDYKISFKTNDFDTFGIWSNLNPNSDFVCIEPWCGFDLDDNMKLSISAKEQKKFDFSISFENCYNN